MKENKLMRKYVGMKKEQNNNRQAARSVSIWI